LGYVLRIAFVASIGAVVCSTGWAAPADAAPEVAPDGGPGAALAPEAVGDPSEVSGPPPVAFVVRIEGMIDLGLGPFVERVLKTAAEQRAAVVVLDVNTFGGRVDAAVVIRDHLLRSPLLTVAFVNKRAISAGALITLAAKKVVMARGATIGAAAPVEMGQPSEAAKPAGEKTVSYVRKEFRATADARKRPGEIAEAMVDADVEIAGVIEKGKLLTLTTAEALRHGVADFEAEELSSLLAQLGLANAEVRTLNENWAERVVRFLTDPVVASLLMTLGMLGVFVELRTPGFGVPGLIGVLSLVLFFWGHFIVELAGWEQLLLVIAGVVLIAIELLALPGFGVVGVLGFAALAVGMSSTLLGAGASLQAVTLAAARVAISTALAAVAALVLFRFLPSLPGGKKLVLATALHGGGRPDSDHVPLTGVVGRSMSPLRPAGIALVSGRRIDVVSDGEFIEPDQAIEVVRDEGNRVVVKRHRPPPPQGNSQ
jgi:membrane-bound serine protease (ClpP class)